MEAWATRRDVRATPSLRMGEVVDEIGSREPLRKRHRGEIAYRTSLDCRALSLWRRHESARCRTGEAVDLADHFGERAAFRFS